MISLPELRGYINEGAAELFDLLVEARGMEWYRRSTTFSTVAYQTAYSMPTDFAESLSVDIYISTNQQITALPYSESDRNIYSNFPAFGWYYNTPVRFRLHGVPSSTGAIAPPPTMTFIPGPSSATQVTVNYIPAFQQFATDGTEDGNVFDGINGWEGFAIWNATAIALEKLEQNSEFARTQLENFRTRIVGLAPDHHAGDPEKVHDILANDSEGLFGSIYR